MGLASVELEVLAQNTPARRLYTRLGFENVRPLAVFTGPLADMRLPWTVRSANRRTSRSSGRWPTSPRSIRRRRPGSGIWRALAHMAPSLHALALMDGETDTRQHSFTCPLASATASWIVGSRAATPDARRDDTIALIRALMAATPGAPVRAINVPPGDPLGDALSALGCPTPHTQWEMLLPLG